MAKIAKKVVKLQKAKKMHSELDQVAAEIADSAKDDGEDWSTGVDLGRACRMVDEHVPSTFGAPAKVIGQMGSKLKLEVEGVFHSVVCEQAQVDWLPQIVPSAPKLPLLLTKIAKTELTFKFPEIEGLQMNERLSGDHVMLGHWIMCREIGYVEGADLLPPMVVVRYCAGKIEKGDDAERCAEKCEQIILRRWRRSGLLGIPVWSSCEGPGTEHWTLLVLRRSGDQISYRYYDSAREISPTNLSSADVVYQFICREMKIEPQAIARCNTAKQGDGISCGAFVLHWWEGELRRFHGEGWPLSYPSTGGNIKDRRQRLVNLVKQIRKFREDLEKEEAEPADAKKKKKKIEAPADPVPVEESSAAVSLEQIKMLDMEKLAKDAADQGTVPFYGCSRCRYSRGGCISYNCNPDKFKVHFEKFPEKYEGKVLKLQITDKELVGGGGGKVDKVRR